MKQKLCALLLSASMLSSLAVPAFAVDASETNALPSQTPGEDVVYLGVENYGKVTKDEIGLMMIHVEHLDEEVQA